MCNVFLILFQSQGFLLIFWTLPIIYISLKLCVWWTYLVKYTVHDMYDVEIVENIKYIYFHVNYYLFDFLIFSKKNYYLKKNLVLYGYDTCT